jgi:hypothetical protein
MLNSPAILFSQNVFGTVRVNFWPRRTRHSLFLEAITMGDDHEYDISHVGG